MKLWLAFALLLSLDGAAHADNKAIARDAYREGTRQYDLGDFNSALAAFKKAYLNYEEPAFLFNIAQCHRMLGDKAEAIRFYKVYLHKLPQTENRAEVERLIAGLESALREERAVRAHPPTETLPPAGEPRTVEPKAIETKQIESKPEAHATAPAAPLVGVAPAAPTPIYKRWWLWTVVGVAAAGVGVGLGVGLYHPKLDPTLKDIGPGAGALVRW
jgi:tetratricopeptide (TPR) repeat protein